MNSFIENINYVAELDNNYGEGVVLSKSNLSLRNVANDITLRFSYFNFNTRKIETVNKTISGMIYSGLETALQEFCSQIESTLGGNKFDASYTISSSNTGFLIHSFIITINSLDEKLKCTEINFNAKITSTQVEIYNLYGNVINPLKMLPSLALMDQNVISNILDNIDIISNIPSQVEIINNSLLEISSMSEDVNNNTTIVIQAKDIAVSSSSSALSSANIATTKANEASTSASSALSSKDSATASATSSSNSATTATAQATIATTKAGEASASATSATTSATSAATSATTATASSANATTKASEAATIATNAASSATASANSATSANTSAATATTKASEASVSSTNAASSATSASASANTATTKASEALTSANNSASSATASANSAAAAATSAANAAAIVGGNISLDSLNNVTVPTPTTNDVLTFNSSVWVNTPSTGSGNNVLATSPTLVTPNIGVATGTSFNSITGLSSITPLANGTAAIGTSTTTARADHVHPLQTTITGNAATATKLATARTINNVSFDGSVNINIEDRLGTAIASAATITIGTAGLGDYIHITGNTNITSFGTASAAGIRRTLIFDSELCTIKNNSSTLICPGSTDIVSTANMVMEVVSESTTSWRVVSITHPSLSYSKLNQLTLNNQSSIKNYIINGNFKLTDYGTSSTVGGYTTENRWNNIATSAVTVTFENIIETAYDSVRDDTSNVSKITFTTSGNALEQIGKTQTIENVLQFLGKTCTLSFWAKADASFIIGSSIKSYFGSGGSATALANTETLHTVDTTWKKFTKTFTLTLSSITLPTAGVSNTGLIIKIIASAGSSVYSTIGNKSGVLYLSNVKLEPGSVASDGWHPYDGEFGGETQACERYLEKGFTINAKALTPTSNKQIYRTKKRVTPTLTVIPLGGTGATWMTSGETFWQTEAHSTQDGANYVANAEFAV